MEKYRLSNNWDVPEEKYVLKSINLGELKLSSTTSELNFKYTPIGSFRITEDVMRLKTYKEQDVLQQYVNDKKFQGIPFFIVEGSEYLKWICRESGGFYTADNTGVKLEHLAIVLEDMIIDIVYDKDIRPQVEVQV